MPVRYLAGRKDLSNGDAPVNLIHRDDCIGILMAIINQNAYGHIFNAVIPEHPSKRIYYTQQADRYELVPPQYADASESSSYKQVDSINISNVLGYTFKHSL